MTEDEYRKTMVIIIGWMAILIIEFCKIEHRHTSIYTSETLNVVTFYIERSASPSSTCPYLKEEILGENCWELSFLP